MLNLPDTANEDLLGLWPSYWVSISPFYALQMLDEDVPLFL